MENMRKVRKTMMKVLGYLIIFLFMMMTAVGSYQIITRYFFNRPSTVSEELLTYSFTWMSLLASAYVFGKRDHMRMGFIYVMVPVSGILIMIFAAMNAVEMFHHEFKEAGEVRV